MFTRQSCLRSKTTDLCRTAAQTGVSAGKSEMTHTDRTILPNHTCSSEIPTQLMSTTKAIFIGKILHLPLLGGRCRYSPGRFQAPTYLKHFAVAPTTPLHEVFLLLAVMCWDICTDVLLCLDVFTNSVGHGSSCQCLCCLSLALSSVISSCILWQCLLQS